MEDRKEGYKKSLEGRGKLGDIEITSQSQKIKEVFKNKTSLMLFIKKAVNLPWMSRVILSNLKFYQNGTKEWPLSIQGWKSPLATLITD